MKPGFVAADPSRLNGGRGQFVLVPLPVIEAVKAGAISHRALALYVMLDQYRNRQTRKAWPGLRTLSSDLRMSINTVMKMRDELVDAELIRVTVPDDRAMPHIYDILYGPEPKVLAVVDGVSKTETRITDPCLSSRLTSDGPDLIPCLSQGETEPSSLRTRGSSVGAAAASAAADMQLLEHFFSEAEKATGAPAVPRWGRDRKLARQILAACAKPVLAESDLEETKRIASRYCKDGRANGWTVTVPGLLQQVDRIRQRMANERGVRPAGAPAREHPMAVTSRREREWRAAHPGEQPQSREQISAWAVEQGR